MPNRTPRQADPQKQPPMPGRGSDIGKDTDGDGRVVQPGHQAGDVDGDRQRKAQSGKQQSGSSVGKDTDGDGRVVQPGRKPGEIDGDRQKQKH